MIERPIYPTDLSEDQAIMQLIGAANRHKLFGIMSAHSILRRQLCLYLLISITFCSGPTKPDEIASPLTALKYDQEPDWSPSGDLIAFYRGRSEPGVSGLYLMNIDGSDLRFLVPRGRAPKWSPQGDRILYSLATDNQIYIYDVASNSSSAITSDNHQKIDAAWFSDGESIVYSIRVGSDSTAGIWKFNLATSSARRIIQLWGRYPSISLSGTYITFIEEASTAVYLSIANVYPDSIGSITRLVSGSQINTPYMQYPSFNTYSTNILFQADDEILYEPREYREHRIYIYNSNGTNDDTITELVYGGVSPAWSPDNNLIIYTQFIMYEQNIIGNGFLWIMNIETKDKWQITYP